MSNSKNNTIASFKQLNNALRQYNSIKKQSTYWFGGVLSTIEILPTMQLLYNIKQQQQQQLCCILSSTLVSALSFYLNQLPQSLFMLLKIYQNCVYGSNNESTFSLLNRINYWNHVGIFSIRNKQYVNAIENYSQAIKIYQKRQNDLAHEITLISYSNYILFCRKSQKNIKNQQTNQLQTLFIKLIKKYQTYRTPNTNFLSLLTAIYHQHTNMLSLYENQLKKLKQLSLIDQSSKRIKSIQNNNKLQNYIKRVFKIQLNKYQINFFLNALSKNSSQQERITKIQTLIQQSLQMLMEEKKRNNYANSRYAKFNKKKNTEQSINKNVNLTTLNTSINDQKDQKQISTIKYNVPLKANKKYTKNNLEVAFKYNSIYISFTQQGILFNDFSKTNSKYIEWNTLAHIVNQLLYTKVFQQYLKTPIHNFYDVVRILCFYLSRTDQGTIKITARPNYLFTIDQLIQVYHQNGPFLKLALLNKYNTERVTGFLDCKLEQYTHYFKQLGQDNYLNNLNNWLLTGQYLQQSIYHLNVIKRKNQITKQQLQQKVVIEVIEQYFHTSFEYKSILILTENINLLLGLKIKDEEQNTIQIHLKQFNKSSNKDVLIRNIIIQPYQYQRYFPFPKDKKLSQSLKLYGRFITLHLTNIKVKQEGLSTNFDVVVHYYQTAMVPFGKYYTNVSIQLIGSENIVTGLVVRSYQLANCTQKIALFMVPYYNLFQPIISLDKELKKQCFKRLLINGNVIDTYNWVKKNGKFDQITSIMKYLDDSNIIN